MIMRISKIIISNIFDWLKRLKSFILNDMIMNKGIFEMIDNNSNGSKE